MGLSDSISDAIAQHQDEVKAGIEKAGDVVDEKTDHKYADKVDLVQEKLSEQVDKASGA